MAIESIHQETGRRAITTTIATDHDGAALEAVVADVVRIGGYQHIADSDGPHVAVSLVHRMIMAITECERAGWSRERILARLQPARAVYADSPFVKRLQDWPRGYPGDFETVEYILTQRNRATPGRLSYWLEQYALDSSIAQQHRNKVDLQARAILDAVLASPTSRAEPRILVLAAGGSPDLRQIQSILTTQRFRAVLLDQDADALAFSAERLTLIQQHLTFVQRNVVRGLGDVRPHGPFNLVLAGGLFDYLPDRVAVLILRVAREHLLESGGRFVFTNIGQANPYRHWIEYLGDWRLIHRSENEVRGLCTEAGFTEPSVSVTSERTGLALIVGCQAAMHA